MRLEYIPLIIILFAILIVVLFFDKPFELTKNEAFRDGYNRAVRDIMQRGYYYDDNGVKHRVFERVDE